MVRFGGILGSYWVLTVLVMVDDGLHDGGNCWILMVLVMVRVYCVLCS